MSDLTYAKVGGPPDDWMKLQVRDLETGELLDRVVEVNAEEGWAVVMRPDLWKNPMPEMPRERVTGRFALERQPG